MTTFARGPVLMITAAEARELEQQIEEERRQSQLERARIQDMATAARIKEALERDVPTMLETIDTRIRSAIRTREREAQHILNKADVAFDEIVKVLKDRLFEAGFDVYLAHTSDTMAYLTITWTPLSRGDRW